MFSGSRKPLILFRIRSGVSGNQKSKMAADKETENACIFACIQDSNEIPTAIPMFSGSRNPMILFRVRPGVSSNWNSQMPAAKPKYTDFWFNGRHFDIPTYDYIG